MNNNRYKMKTNSGLLLTYSVFADMILVAFAYTMPGFMLSYFIQQYGLESARQGVIGTMTSAGGLVALLFTSFLAGRIKKGVLVMLGSAGLALTLAAIGSTPPFAALLVCLALFGFAFSVVDTANSAVIADIHQGENGKRFMGMLHGMFGIGSLAAPLFYQMLIDGGVEWNAVFFIMAGMLATITVLFFMIYRSGASNSAAVAADVNKTTVKDIIAFAKNKRNLLFLAVVMFYAFSQNGVTMWGKRFIADYLAAGALGALAMSLFWIGTTASRLLMPRTPFTPMQIIMWGNLGSGAALIIGILSGNASFAAGCYLAAGFLQGSSIPMLLTIVNSWYPKNTLMATTCMFFTQNVSHMICPLLIGAVAGESGLGAGLMLSAVCGILTAAAMFALLMEQKNEASNKAD